MNLSYLRANANFETVIVGLILLAFVAVVAHGTRQGLERETPIGVHPAASSSPALGD